jgi:hypothetical protein
MELSRRAFLGSAAAIAAPRPAGLSVACTLEESRLAFRGLPPFTEVCSDRRVLVESAVGFAPEDLTWLERCGISMGAPVPVTGPAWVRFTWPLQAMVRDFGRVRPVTGGQVIARLGPVPVAVRRGRFIVLGSPLGPHVYAGDRDAHNLLQGIIRSSV